MPTTGLTVYPAPPTVIPSPIGWNSYQDGDTVDFNGTATVWGMAPVANVYTLTQNLNVKNLTIRSGVRVKSNGYVIVAKLFVIESGGYLSFNGNDASSGTAGGSFLAANTGHLGCACGAGGAGASAAAVGANVNGTGGSGSGSASIGGVSGAGGKAGTGTGGNGNVTTVLPASQYRYWRSVSTAVTYWRIPPTGNTVATVLVNGGGGGGGGAANMTGGVGTVVGGGGGGAAGIIGIRAGTLNSKGVIECVGGTGGNGSVTGTATGNAGGGGGGAGGAIHVVCDKLISAGTMRVSGGAGGTALGTGFAGLPGTPGTLDLFVAGETY